MQKKKTFAVVGGDKRSAYMADILAKRGDSFEVYPIYLEKHAGFRGDISALGKSDVIIFGLPMLNADEKISTSLSHQPLTLEECLEYIKPGAIVFGGNIPDSAMNLFAERGIPIIDYLKREELAVLNAVLTAEGALEIAMRETSISIFGANCLVTGFGRISKSLARLLAGFGANVYVAARSPSDLAWIRAMGYSAIYIENIAECLPAANILFNTVPSLILGESELQKLSKDCLVIDLASNPGGVDFQAAQNIGLRTIWALSLPGRVAPITAGEIILDTVLGILYERGEINE